MTFEPLTKDMLEHYGSVKCTECVVSALEGLKKDIRCDCDADDGDTPIYTMSEAINLVDKWFPFVHQMKTDSFDKAGEVFHKECGCVCHDKGKVRE